MPEDRTNGGIAVIEIDIHETLCTEDFLFNVCVCEGWGVGHERTYQGVLWFIMGTLPAGVRVHDIVDLINI